MGDMVCLSSLPIGIAYVVRIISAARGSRQPHARAHWGPQPRREEHMGAVKPAAVTRVPGVWVLGGRLREQESLPRILGLALLFSASLYEV